MDARTYEQIVNKPGQVTLELESTERFLLCVALREYLGGNRRSLSSDTQLVDHPSSKAIIEGILKRLDPPAPGVPL
jgi:hypothetical protein